ncbi:MAG: ABC transporter permease subunit [Gammaproteobacteria bacterium]
MLLFFLVPFLIVVGMSLATKTPTAPPISFGGDYPLVNVQGYVRAVSDTLYFRAFITSLVSAGIATMFCLLIGYPMALALTRVSKSWRNILLMLVILPFWTSFLLRVYAWKILLQGNGVLNAALLGLGLIERPLTLLYTPFAVQLGIVYSYLPFMVLPLYAALARLDRGLVEAALDLGARPWQAFLRVTVPLALPGVLAGCLLVFVPAVGEFVIPELLGGSDSLMIGRVLWTEFFNNRDWPLAAAVATAMLCVLVLPVAYLQSRSPSAPGDGAARVREAQVREAQVREAQVREARVRVSRGQS